jgi:hypothetical protein
MITVVDLYCILKDVFIKYMLSYLSGCHKQKIAATDISYISIHCQDEIVPYERIENYKNFFLKKDNEKYKRMIFRDIEHKIRNFVKLTPNEMDRIRVLDEEDKIKLIQILNYCTGTLLEYITNLE